MAEESWHAARLIPTSGISGAEEQERRATSALLAVIPAVKEFGRALLGPLGAPAGQVEAYIEVPFKLGEQTLIPDGLIRVKRGTKVWTALVEVKTKTNALEVQQLDNYLDLAREQGFDTVITISNQVPPAPGLHPTPVDRRKLRKVALVHLPWVKILSTAVMQKEFRGVADPDQAFILGELIRYLEHPRSGALTFDDMGPSWVPVRESVHSGTIRATDRGVLEVTSRFDALLQYVGLRLGQRLGADVQHVLSRKEVADPSLRSQALTQSLSSAGTLSGVLRIAHAAADLHVVADLRTSTIACHCEVDAPREGRSKTRINWLVRQLKDAPPSIRIEAYAMHARAGAAELLKNVREQPELLVTDPQREMRAFRVTQMSALGTKRGTGRGGFIDSFVDAVDSFYLDVLQNLKVWTAAAPRLREEPEVVGVAPALASTALSSQDEPDTSAPRTLASPTPAHGADDVDEVPGVGS